MKRFSAIGILTVLLTVVGLAASCGSQTALRDRIAVTAIGIDGAAGAYTVSVQAIEALKTAAGLSEQNESATAVYTASGASVSAALDAFLDEAGRKAYILQNRLTVVSETACQSGSLLDTLDYLIRHAEGRAQVPVAVCRGEPTALLDMKTDSDAIAASYPVGILSEGAKNGLCVRSTVWDIQCAASGMTDLALPILSMRGERPRVDGTMLFQNGMAAGELTTEETLGLSLLTGQTEEVRCVSDGITYAVEALRCRTEVQRDGDRFAFRFAVSGTASVIENQGDTEPQAAVVERFLEERIRAALAKLDAVDCDPLGLARRAAQHDPAVTQKTARSQLAACDKAVSVRLVLRVNSPEYSG